MLFVPQRIYRVFSGGLEGGVDSEDDAGDAGDDEAEEDGGERECEDPADGEEGGEDEVEYADDRGADGDTCCPADDGEQQLDGMLARAVAATTLDEVRQVWREAATAGIIDDPVDGRPFKEHLVDLSEQLRAADEPQITVEQQKRLHATFADKGIQDRADKLAFLSEVLGRQVTTSTALTREEARQAIDALAMLDPVQSLVDPDTGEAADLYAGWVAGLPLDGRNARPLRALLLEHRPDKRTVIEECQRVVGQPLDGGLTAGQTTSLHAALHRQFGQEVPA